MNRPGCEAIVGLGANLGDTMATLIKAEERLQELSERPLVRSSFWQTTPIDCPPGSPPFVNAVVILAPRALETPEWLLSKLQKLERGFGRNPKRLLNEARPLDLDLLAFGDEVRATKELTLPHPRAHLRRFVLEPLCEVRPDLVLPGQARTVAQLLALLPHDPAMKLLANDRGG